MDNAEVRANLSGIISKMEKAAYLPPGEEQPGGMPLTPEAMAAPPMDPMAAAGGMPMDPAMMGGMPMDPAMMGGAPMPPVDPMTGMPMDPAMMGGAPADPMAALEGILPGADAAAAGAEAPATVTVPIDDFRQLIDTVVKMSKEMTNIAGKAADGGASSGDADRIAALEEKVGLMADALGIEDPAPTVPVTPPPAEKAAALDNINKLQNLLDSLG